MKNKLLYAVLVAFVVTCACVVWVWYKVLEYFPDPPPTEVYYTFEDVIIKRVDENIKTTLYYLQDGVPIDTIWVHYSGRDAWFDSYLYFLPDKTILVDGGYVERKRESPFMFRIDRLDYEPLDRYFEKKIINGTVHIISQPEYDLLLDSLTKEGRKYEIVLTDPENERDLFNKDNPLTKVKMTTKMP